MKEILSPQFQQASAAWLLLMDQFGFRMKQEEKQTPENESQTTILQM